MGGIDQVIERIVVSKEPLIVDDQHRYWVGSERKPIPGVTEVIRDVGLSNYDHINPGTLEYAAQRGTYVAEATALYDKGELDEAALDLILVPFLTAWKGFLRDSGFKPTLIEDMGYDEIHWFSGRIDRGGRIRRNTVVIEIKTGQKARFWRWQTAAYSMIFYPSQIPIRLAVILGDNGIYSTEEYLTQDFPRDKQVFLSALDVYNEKRGL